MRISKQRCNTKASGFQPRADRAKGTPPQEGLDRNRAEAGTGRRASSRCLVEIDLGAKVPGPSDPTTNVCNKAEIDQLG